MISGEHRYSLDDKGRLMIPARVRIEVTGSLMILTRGIDDCLWLFPPDEWKAIAENLIATTSPFQEKARLIQRRILAPAHEIEIDRSGRIIVPQILREYAGLRKECTILGMLKYLEIWDEEKYLAYLEKNEDQFKKAAEELGDSITF